MYLDLSCRAKQTDSPQLPCSHRESRLVLLTWGRQVRGKHLYSSQEWGWGLAGKKKEDMTDMLLPACDGSVTSSISQVSSKRCMPLEQLGCQGQPWKAALFQRQSLKPLAPGPHKPGSDRQKVGGLSQPDPSVRLQDRANMLRWV